MANKHIDNLNKFFEQHPVMDSEYESSKRPGGVMRLPSHRSGFAAADDSASEISSNAPESPFSPPAWRPPESSSAWYRHQPYLQDSPIARSSGRGSAQTRDDGNARQSLPLFDDDGILAANVPLPRGSESPLKGLSPEPQLVSRPSTRHTSPEDAMVKPDNIKREDERNTGSDDQQSYIRFSFNALVQQRTEPLEQAVLWIGSTYRSVTSSKKRLITTAIAALFFSISIRLLFSPPPVQPQHDLIKLASFARRFEPMIRYSEAGVSQLGELTATTAAVWDLGESIRVANFTSSALIVAELEGLENSLQQLATALTGFYAVVDGDCDSIVSTLDWAKRHIGHIGTERDSTLSTAVGNMHAGLSSIGVLSSTNNTNVGNKVFDLIFGTPRYVQMSMQTSRTFFEILQTLEKAIDSELIQAGSLFSLLKAIEQQFKNLQGITAREADVQQADEDKLLSSLWERALGTRATKLMKFERNKVLLEQLRARTVLNKQMLLEHEQRLTMLRQGLDQVRKALVKPLLSADLDKAGISGVFTDAWDLKEQVQSLEETRDYMTNVREQQKKLVMQHIGITNGQKVSRLEIEGV